MTEMAEVVKQTLIDAVEVDYEEELRDVAPPDADFRKYARDALSPVRIREQWGIFTQTLPHAVQKGECLLEIGSGFGGFVACAGQVGLKAFGVEPAMRRAKLAEQVVHNPGIMSGCSLIVANGEHLPFPSEAFNYVYSINVMEHVQDPEWVMAEAIRVLKLNGILHFTIPNYGSWWEGHYGLLWLPGIGKRLAKLYVRLLGRRSDYIDALNFLDHRRVSRIMENHTSNMEVLDWGQGVWEERLNSLTVGEWAALGRLKYIVHWLHRLGLVWIISGVGRILHWETPIILIARKRA